MEKSTQAQIIRWGVPGLIISLLGAVAWLVKEWPELERQYRPAFRIQLLLAIEHPHGPEDLALYALTNDAEELIARKNITTLLRLQITNTSPERLMITNRRLEQLTSGGWVPMETVPMNLYQLGVWHPENGTINIIDLGEPFLDTVFLARTLEPNDTITGFLCAHVDGPRAKKMRLRLTDNTGRVTLAEISRDSYGDQAYPLTMHFGANARPKYPVPAH